MTRDKFLTVRGRRDAKINGHVYRARVPRGEKCRKPTSSGGARPRGNSVAAAGQLVAADH